MTVQIAQVQQKGSHSGDMIPGGWRWVKLGEVCEIVMGQSPEGESYNVSGRGEPLLNGPTEFGEKSPTPVQWTTSPTRFCAAGDILLCVRGATTGRKNLADRRYCIGRGLAAIRGKLDLAHTEFLWFALDLATEQILKEASGSTFPNIPGEKLEQVEIPLSPLAEQKRIAGILKEQMAAVERARRSAEGQLQAAEHLPPVYLRAVFDSDETQAWPKRKLGDVAVLERGKFTPRPRNDPRYFGGPYKWIQIGEVEAAEKYILEHRGTLNELGLSVSKMFPKGTLVISIAASIGAVGILGFDSCMPDSLVGITPRAGLGDSEYLYYWLSFAREHLESIAPQMAQANLKLGMLNPLELPIPPLAVQRRIAAQLSSQMASAERLRRTLAKQLDAINTLPSALLRRAFSGEL